MCLAKITTVRSIDGNNATTADGRIVKLGPLEGSVTQGDQLEVYADIALQKISADDVERITATRRNQ